MFVDADSFHIDINTVNAMAQNEAVVLGNLHDCILREIRIIPNTKDAYIDVYSRITQTAVTLKIGGLTGTIYAGVGDYDELSNEDFRLDCGGVEDGAKYVKPIDVALAQNKYPFVSKTDQEMSNSIALNLYYINQERIVMLCESVSYEPEEGEEPKWNALRPKREDSK